MQIDARDGRAWDALLHAGTHAQPARALKKYDWQAQLINQYYWFWVGLNVKSPRTRPKPHVISLVLHIVQCLFYHM